MYRYPGSKLMNRKEYCCPVFFSFSGNVRYTGLGDGGSDEEMSMRSASGRQRSPSHRNELFHSMNKCRSDVLKVMIDAMTRHFGYCWS